eukprot:TRINITY_DN1043_c0_g1_i4.p1 TRINITY_DN1043_c0_g1~~TRINITY_DN1043_c0_g1_i4.p1  ORF type:complete len:446 (-),score=81.83 TRINITY_DN1043_c0_g1_i4:309-1646(-)
MIPLFSAYLQCYWESRMIVVYIIIFVLFACLFRFVSKTYLEMKINLLCINNFKHVSPQLNLNHLLSNFVQSRVLSRVNSCKYSTTTTPSIQTNNPTPTTHGNKQTKQFQQKRPLNFRENSNVHKHIDLKCDKDKTPHNDLSLVFSCKYVPQSIVQKIGPQLVLRNEWENNTKVLERIRSIFKTERIKEEDITLEQAFSLRNWMLIKKEIETYPLLKVSSSKLQHLYDVQNKTMSEITQLYDFRPSTILFSILAAKGWSRKKIASIAKFSRDKDLSKFPPLSEKHKEDLEVHTKHLYPDKHAKLFEEEVFKYWRSRGVLFSTQNEIISSMNLVSNALQIPPLTPDILISPNQKVFITINNKITRIYWIEIKMYFGSGLDPQKKTMIDQIKKYSTHLGPGLLVFSCGLVDSLQKEIEHDFTCLSIDARVLGLNFNYFVDYVIPDKKL